MSEPRDSDPPSKTRRKRDAEALQSLGEALVALPPATLDALQLPERLRDALDALAQIKSREALRRQRQYVGRLMRDVDPEPLQRAVEEASRPGREAARRFRETAAWRDRIAAEGAPAIVRFLAAHPGGDEAALHAALADLQAGRAGAAKRLFRLLSEAM